MNVDFEMKLGSKDSPSWLMMLRLPILQVKINIQHFVICTSEKTENFNS